MSKFGRQSRQLLRKGSVVEAQAWQMRKSTENRYKGGLAQEAKNRLNAVSREEFHRGIPSVLEIFLTAAAGLDEGPAVPEQVG